jgi:hypothetical protein
VPAILAVVATLVAAVPALGVNGLVINGGAPATNDPTLSLALQPPPAAAFVQVARDETFHATTTFAAAPQVTVSIPTAGPEERTVRLWVRYLNVDSVALPDPPLTEAIVFDTLPPRVDAATFTQKTPVYICAAGGPDVGGTNRAAPLTFNLQVTMAEAGSGSPEFELVDATPPVTGWKPPAPVLLQAAPQSLLDIRTRDALGNVSAPTAVTIPAAILTELVPSQFPFASALDCPHPSPARWNRTIRAAWVRSGRKARQKERVLVPGSQLAWTFYKGHGLALNWVIAGTELKGLLAQKRLDEYRAGIAEALALSITDVSDRGRRFRVNENWFGTPGDDRGFPWRDGMGTAVLLASLTPAIRSDAPRHERELALRTASEYLETFSVDWSDGGVLWRERGPGQWFLEYTYRHRERVLNGFMQSIISLDRFSRQADRLGRDSAEWRALASRARTHVLKGSRALAYWLPTFDLGGGKTRYSLTGGPAPAFYQQYHQELLGQLAAIPYVPLATRQRFMNYRSRWGGTRLPVV